MKKIWIFQTGEPVHFDNVKLRPMRAMNLADNLLKRNYEITIWTSNFYHQFKEKRFQDSAVIESGNLTIKYIDSPGYSKNIGIARLIDHFILGVNLLLKLLKEKEHPDVAFLGFPPIEFAFFASVWLKWKRVPFVLDVKDQWPDIFIANQPRKIKIILKLVLFPYFFMSIYSMKNASAFSSMSSSFIKWIYNFSRLKKKKPEISVPLTSNSFNISSSKTFNKKFLMQLNIFDDDKIKVLFIGSLSQVFDFDTVIKSLNLAKNRNLCIQLIICGAGHQHDRLKEMAIRDDLDILFVGWASIEEISALATISTVAIAPYKDSQDFLTSIPNKISDYLSLGLPILSPLGGKVKRLIVQKKAGFFYKQYDYVDLLNKLLYLSKHKDISLNIKKNNIEIFKKEFDSNNAYNKLSEFLINLKK